MAQRENCHRLVLIHITQTNTFTNKEKWHTGMIFLKVTVAEREEQHNWLKIVKKDL